MPEQREVFSVMSNQWEGLRTREAEMELPPGALVSALNIEFFRKGWGTRGGFERLNAVSAGTDPINGIFDGFNHVLVMEGQKLHRYAAGALTQIATGLTNNAIPSFASYNALDLFVNGSASSENPKKWNGSTLADIGGSPPKADFIEVWRSHVWLGGLASPNQSQLQRSTHENPEEYGAYYNVAKRQKGSSITGMAVCPTGSREDEGVLVIFSEDMIHHFTGYTRLSFNLTPVNHKIGCISHRSIVVAESMTYWVDESGIFCSGDGGVTYNKISWRIQPDFDNLNSSRLQYSTGVAFRGKRQILWSFSDGTSSTHNIVFVYHYGLSDPLSHAQDGRHVWSIWKVKNGDTGINSFGEVESSGDYLCYAGDSKDGVLYQVDSGAVDDEETIDWHLKTKRFVFQDWSSYSVLRKLVLLHDAVSGATVRVDLFPDNSQASSDPRVLDLSAGGARWGEVGWGTSVFASGALAPSTISYSRQMRAVQWKISGGDSGKQFTCYGIQGEFRRLRGYR